MLRNYLKIAFRNILKHKSYSFINILGLGGSIATTILILLYAQSVLTYDQFHRDSDQVYFMYRDRPTEDGRLDVYDTWFPMVDAAKEEFPEVIVGTRFANFGNTWVENGEKRFEQSITMADSNFFEVFSFKLLKGDPATALDNPDAVIIHKRVAEKFFGEEDPLGQTLIFGFSRERIVTGVLDDIPTNSSFTFECIAPLTMSMVRGWMGDNLWGGSFCDSFIKLRADVSPDQLRGKLNVLMEKYVNEQEQGNFLILPLKDYFEKMTGGKKYAKIMLLVAFGILLTAIINFTNLSTAQSLLRYKELGIRKVLGANRKRLVYQLLGESVIMGIISLVLGGLLAELLLPQFNELIGMQLQIEYSAIYLSLLFIIGVMTGAMSGVYPALFITRNQASEVLKNQSVRPGKLSVRNGLVAVQFILAIALISGVGVINSQIDFLKSHDLNFDQDNAMVIPLSLRDFEDPQAALPRVISFRNELRQLPGVKNVTGSNSVPGNYRRSFSLFLPKGKDIPPLDWQVAVVGHDFFDTYGIDLLEGRAFNEGSQSDFNSGVILNETAMKQIGWESIEGKKLMFPRSRDELDIIGLVKDFNVQSLREPVQPLVHFYGGDSARSYSFITLKLTPASREATIKAIAETWERMDFGIQYEYYFPAERFKELYETEENIASVLEYAMAFAIVIACLGLYALASFSIMLKTKEIAIRKVLGASVGRIVHSFSKQYLLIVLIAGIPAVVIAWYGMVKWLEDFAYRVTISPWIFLIAIVGAAVIAIATVSYHALKAGFINPVDSLKEE